VIKIEQKQILQSIFSVKQDFRTGLAAPKRVFDGIEITPFLNDCKAAVSISADFELNWAFRSMAVEERDQLGVSERQNVPHILDLLEEFAIPITWATVGHLFLTSCTRENDVAHPCMPRPPANELWSGDWYKHDPCTNLQTDPLWYAPDLIEQVVRSKVKHEIASHSFSHIDFSPHTSSHELVKREMEESLAAMAPFGLKLKSVVFPFNHMGHSYHDLLSQFGIIAVRHRDENIRFSYPERTASGVYKVYETMNLRSAKYYNYRDKAELFVDHAIQHGAAYHLWFHPSDPRSVFETVFYEILQIIKRQREAGNLWVATMADLVSYCEARECMSIQSETDGSTRKIEIQSSLNTGKYGIPEVSLIVPAMTMPKRIERRLDDRLESIAPATVCTLTSDKLLLNLPAQTQAIVLTF
jgi:peptidoglycan/xylan/chitin deacetylase (PgdA/CDA1 family)